MLRAATVVAALLLAPVLGIAAQALLYSNVGHQVRLQTDSDSRWLVGTLVAAGKDSIQLRVADNAPLMSIARSRVSQFELRHEGHSNAGKGALIGRGVGALSGAVIGAASASGCTSWCFYSPGVGAVAGALVFGGAGALLGAVVGSVSHSSGWEAVSLIRTPVTLAPPGAGLAISLKF